MIQLLPIIRLWTSALLIAAALHPLHGAAVTAPDLLDTGLHAHGEHAYASHGSSSMLMQESSVSQRRLHDATLAPSDCGGVGRRACTTDFLDNAGCRPGLAPSIDTICLPDTSLDTFPCALDGQRCCLGTCARRLNCDSGDRCVRCGGLLEPVCVDEGPACADGLVDVRGTCSSADARTCGSTGQRCCSGNVCKTKNVCEGGRCQRCGGRNTPFCPFQRGCNGRLRVDNGLCTRLGADSSEPVTQPACGLVGEAVCTSGRGCATGLQAYNGRCVPELQNLRPCGVENQACCTGGTCPRALECADNICVKPAADAPVPSPPPSRGQPPASPPPGRRRVPRRAPTRQRTRPAAQ